MFIERVKENFTIYDPIFTDEILKLFPEYSRAQIFRMIKKALSNGEIMQFSRGVYILPKETIFGTIKPTTPEFIAIKRYMEYQGDIYGIVCGLQLLNIFRITSQVPAVLDIVTNKESTRRREIQINNFKFVLHKSRVTITSDNYAVYTILQLFTDFADSDEFDYYSREYILNYIKSHKVTKEKILEMLQYFPGRTAKLMARSNILNEIA